MKAFLLKYKGGILFWLVLLSIVLYFAPRQSDYYLDDDIKYFKSHYLTLTLLWTGVIISVVLLFILFIKTKSIKQSALSFLIGAVNIAFFLFVFQNLFLAAALFINRQIKRGSLQKVYVINYMTGAEKAKENFIPYDVSAKQISIDHKLTNKLYKPGLKQNDTVTLQLGKGLLGIAFQSQPFDEK